MNFNKINDFRRKSVIVLLFPFLYITILFFRILPIKLTRRFAVFVGKRFYRMANKSRNRALDNLKMVYGSKTTEKEREAMAQAVFIEEIKSFFDYMAYSRLTDKKKYFSLVEVAGEEHLRRAYAKGKGVICLMPHLSSWEFAAITPPMLGYETSAASKSMKAQVLERLMVKFRERRGMKNITREGSYGKLAETLRRGECLVIMIDQDTKVKSVFVDFMGKQAYTPLGASRLALETGALVVPMAMTRKADDNYRFIIYPELPAVKTGDTEGDLFENTRRQTAVMESIIREYTLQWFWMHRRWRTTPEMVEKYRKNKNRQNQ
jgi:KDO2-lipid IV(A) lauroyltransferase